MKQRTVRELAGEIWAEVDMEIRAKPELYPAGDRKALVDLVDRSMGLLARHFDTVITNDAAGPVPPLPYRFPSDKELLEFKGSGELKTCTIMDLSAELRSEMKEDRSPVDHKTFELIIETAKGVLARFEGVVIVDDDEGMPVAPLPPIE